MSGPPHSVAVALCATPARLTETRLQQKLLRKKKNESWAMRRFENIRGLTSPTLGVGGNLLCKIVQFGFFGVAHPSRMLVSASRRNSLSLTRESRSASTQQEKSAIARRARQHPRRARYPIRIRSRYSSSRPSFVSRRKRRRLLRQLKRKWSQSSSQRRVSIFRWINRPQARA